MCNDSRRFIIRIGTTLIICFAIFLMGCTRQQKGSEQGQTTGTERIPVKYTVNIHLMKFIPDTIQIYPGDTLLFTNNDIVDHNVTDFPGLKWASPTLKSGDSWTYVPAGSGTYFCSIHQVMKGEIVIKNP